MQTAFRTDYDQDYLAVDQLLITATIFGVTAETPGIPPEGALVTIRKPSKLRLFMDKACQLTTKLNQLSFDTKKGQ
ncbi:hypothetical protein PF002_g19075 [Phytophthora fragariae]|uniref:Uncharacterized protein n=1 Tax=Phytophthora fragariae TaxID=53985 RepID=A0A6A3XWH4_9STRA|nr:hypothetical protein PF002_g19075 [Phytophthora fragariae]KAE9295599.1 hypothetical protein PF001_g17252 [Phytophthora fragariae]